MDEHDVAENLAGTDNDMYDEPSIDMDAVSVLAEHIAVESDRLADLKSEHTRGCEALKQAKTDLYDMGVASGIMKFTTVNGLSISLNIKTKYGRGRGVDDDTIFMFLRANNLGDIIKETIHHGTLNSAMKEFIEAGGVIPNVNTIDKDGNEGNGPAINNWEEKGCRMNNYGKFLLGLAKKGE